MDNLLVLSLAGVAVVAVLAIVMHARRGRGLDPASDTVILVSLDGVRADEVLHGPDPAQGGCAGDGTPMPVLMNELVPKGVFLGDRSKGNRFTIGGPVGLSMSSYQAMFAGRMTAAVSNEAAPLPKNSLLVRLSKVFGADRLGFSVSWEPLRKGLRAEGTVAHIASDLPAQGRWAQEDYRDYEWPGAKDILAFKAGLAMLREKRPKFLFIMFDESDAYGHLNDYDGHIGMLELYDSFIEELRDEMAALSQEGHKSTLLVLTDHGRGEGAQWHGHEMSVKGSHWSWMVAYGHGIAQKGVLEGGPKRSLVHVRPLVEHLLGLRPARRPAPPEVLSEP